MKRWIATGLAALMLTTSSITTFAQDARFQMGDTVRQSLNGQELSPKGSGVPGLDDAAQQIIDQCVQDDMDAASQLQACFDFVVTHMNNDNTDPKITYQSDELAAFFMGPEEAWAWRALEWDFGGTCPEYAALFLLLARQLGYTGNMIVGQTPASGGGLTEHKWVELTINGNTCIFDPYLEQSFVQRGIATPGTFFCTTYEQQPNRFVNGRAPIQRTIDLGNGQTIMIYE